MGVPQTRRKGFKRLLDGSGPHANALRLIRTHSH